MTRHFEHRFEHSPVADPAIPDRSDHVLATDQGVGLIRCLLHRSTSSTQRASPFPRRLVADALVAAQRVRDRAPGMRIPVARASLSPCVVGLPVAAFTGMGGRYERHKPEDTLLYRIVAEHLETFLAEAREKHERGLPGYVEKELREYLKCGLLSHGFLRAR